MRCTLWGGGGVGWDIFGQGVQFRRDDRVAADHCPAYSERTIARGFCAFILILTDI